MRLLRNIVNAPFYWLIRHLVADPKNFIRYKGIAIVEGGLDGFKQIGDPLFVEKTKDALDYIEATDPLRFKRVQRFIKVIVYSNRALARYHHKMNGCYVGFAHFHFEDDAPHKIPWYACVLIHEATHGVFYSRNIPYTRRTKEKIEYFCVLEEWKFSQKFNDGLDWYDWIWTRVIDRAWDPDRKESRIDRFKTTFRANANGELEKKHKKLEPTLKTPVESGKAQGTQGHPKRSTE